MNAKIGKISVLIGVGLMLWLIEAMIALPLPIRIGFANIATVVAIYRIGRVEAIWVSLGRIVIGSLILGRLLSMTMVLSLSGAVLALLAMLVLVYYFSPVGVSIAGGWFNIVGQFMAAWFLIYRGTELFFFFPLFGITGIVCGAVIGILSMRIVKPLSEMGQG